MSQEQRIKIPRASDRSVVDCFKELGELLNVTTISVSTMPFSEIGAINFSGEPNADFEALIAHDSTLINACSMTIPGLNIVYHRGGEYQPTEKSPIYDEVNLRLNQQSNDLTITDKLSIVTLINSKLKAFEPGRFVESGLSKEQNQLLAIHQGTLERLERLNEDLIRKSVDFREDLEEQFRLKTTELESETRTKQEKLEEDNTRKSQALEEKETALKEKLSAIDDRDNTHVRREIRDRMLDDVKKRISTFGVSQTTEKKRNPVLFGIELLFFILLGLVSFTVYEISQLGESYATEFFWLWGRLAVSSFGLFGTILYYIRWQNRWAEQHSAAEFQLQQFHIDVNRANWVIESCLEWRKETDSVIPGELLKSITRNLFKSEQGELEQALHPADELASALFGSASRVKLNVAGNEVEYDKPGKIKNK